MIDTDDEVKKALNYLVGFKDEMTSDKKHYTEVLIKEVKRLREQLDNVRYWVSSHEDEHMMEIFKMWIGEEE